MADRTGFLEAQELARDIAALSDEKLVACWHSYAGQISFHHADDSAKEWHLASEMRPKFLEVETAIMERGLPKPMGEYLLGFGFRIDWASADA